VPRRRAGEARIHCSQLGQKLDFKPLRIGRPHSAQITCFSRIYGQVKELAPVVFVMVHKLQVTAPYG
jgi:hypothetical protein